MSKPAPCRSVKRRPRVIPNAGPFPYLRHACASRRARHYLTGVHEVTENVDSAGGRDIGTRRRRAAYRAHHRGTKEMDWLLGRYADAHLENLADTDLAEFERFLELPDPELQKWILEPALAAGVDFDGLIARIRAFHGLTVAGQG